MIKTTYKHLKLFNQYYCILAAIFFLIPQTAFAFDDTFLDIKTGIGIFKYREQTTAFGTATESNLINKIILLKAYGEYPLLRNTYTGASIELGQSSKDSETWWQDKIKYQTNDAHIDVQYYNVRWGYKNSRKAMETELLWKLFLNYGRDIQDFNRSNFVVSGILQGDASFKEKFDLQRYGAGFSFEWVKKELTVSGEISYGHYPDGEIKNSIIPGTILNTEGNRIDIISVLSYKISDAVNASLGISYSRIALHESDIIAGTIFPNSETEIITGTIGLNIH